MPGKMVLQIEPFSQTVRHWQKLVMPHNPLWIMTGGPSQRWLKFRSSSEEIATTHANTSQGHRATVRTDGQNWADLLIFVSLFR